MCKGEQLGLPAPVTAATGMDALAHAIECYTCAYAQPFADAVALLAMEYVGQYLRVAYAQGANVEARYKMSMAAMLGGMAYGKESAGAAHAMSQSAGGVHDVPHGALTARVLGPVMEYNYMGEPHKFARIAQALGEDTRGLSVWAAAEVITRDDTASDTPGSRERGGPPRRRLSSRAASTAAASDDRLVTFCASSCRTTAAPSWNRLASSASGRFLGSSAASRAA